ncbi:MAG: hypothetical protein ACREKM_01290, partial [Longimicrobiales bacterium]
VGASELAARVAAALPIFGDRLTVGAAAGMVTVSLAEARRIAPVFDMGAQYDLPFVTLGASLRNLGPDMSGAGLADAPLPSEARIGAATSWQRADGWGGSLNADVVTLLQEKRTGLLLGAEAGLMPATTMGISAVARVGIDATQGRDAIGAFRFGAGVGFGRVDLDYAYQDFDAFGGVHRIGLRWAR